MSYKKKILLSIVWLSHMVPMQGSEPSLGFTYNHLIAITIGALITICSATSSSCQCIDDSCHRGLKLLECDACMYARIKKQKKIVSRLCEYKKKEIPVSNES